MSDVIYWPIIQIMLPSLAIGIVFIAGIYAGAWLLFELFIRISNKVEQVTR